MLWNDLYEYQKDAVRWMVSKPGAGLFGEQGIGKTWILAGFIEVVEAALDQFEALLVVPLANIESTWEKLLVDKLPRIAVVRNWDTYKATTGPKVFLIHYQLMLKLKDRLVKRHWSLVAYDECQGLKNRGSKASRAAARFDTVDYRIGMSGTPIEKKPLDLWAQARFFAPWLFGKHWGRFESEYTLPCGYMGKERKMRQDKLPQFMKKLEKWCLRIAKKDVLDLPPLRKVWAGVELRGQQKSVYETMEKDFVLRVGGSTTTADFEATKLIKLQQICGGFIKDDEGELVFLGGAKMRKLKSILKRHEPPVVIFARFKEEIRQVCSALSGRYSYEVISGDTHKADRASIIEDFQAGQIQALVCQISAGGVGIDLYRSCVGVVYSSTWSYIDYDQMLARLHRNGQTRPVIFYLIYAKNTVDQDIYLALDSKQSVSDFVLNRLKGTPMARKKTKVTKKTAAAVKRHKKNKAKAAKKPAETPVRRHRKEKYGVEDLAEMFGLAEVSIRVRLRKAKIKRTGKAYGWNTKTELKAVADKIRLDRDG